MISRIAVFSGLFLIACGGATLDPTGATASDGGTSSDSGTPANPCVDACVSSDLSWATNGGLSSFNPSSTLSCSSYLYDQSSGSGDLSCTDTLANSCSAPGITSGNVAQAFFNADVTAAFAGQTTLYGSDPRGCDGQVFDITYQGKTISIGGDCSAAGNCGGPSNNCVAVPAGLDALMTLLQQLDEQELKTPKCASVFPGR